MDLHTNAEPGVLCLIIADEMNLAIEVKGDSIAVRQSFCSRNHREGGLNLLVEVHRNHGAVGRGEGEDAIRTVDVSHVKDSIRVHAVIWAGNVDLVHLINDVNLVRFLSEGFFEHSNHALASSSPLECFLDVPLKLIIPPVCGMFLRRPLGQNPVIDQFQVLLLLLFVKLGVEDTVVGHNETQQGIVHVVQRVNDEGEQVIGVLHKLALPVTLPDILSLVGLFSGYNMSQLLEHEGRGHCQSRAEYGPLNNG
mmetsp:Transcript_32218/g.59989  ORF Transcript_32218/g.59989 Transcript_32218/m.59989 type:complete len:252 (+) Transcript_32218:696-1451(+)